jgi:hypothetical protein
VADDNREEKTFSLDRRTQKLLNRFFCFFFCARQSAIAPVAGTRAMRVKMTRPPSSQKTESQVDAKRMEHTRDKAFATSLA